MIADDLSDKPEIIRHFGTEEELLKKTLEIYELVQDKEFVFHARAASPGSWKNLDNVHPFQVIDGVWLVHNGYIDIDCSSSSTMCDSWHYAKWIGKEYKEKVLDKGWDKTVTEWIGWEKNKEKIEKFLTKQNRSKVVILDKRGFIILNEKEGFWNEGVWFSNRSPFHEVDFRSNGVTHYQNPYGPQGFKKNKLLEAAKIDTGLNKFKERKTISEAEIEEIEKRIDAAASVKEKANKEFEKVMQEVKEIREEIQTFHPQNNQPETLAEPDPDDTTGWTVDWAEPIFKEVIPFLEEAVDASVDEIKKMINKKGHLLTAKVIHHLINLELFRPIEGASVDKEDTPLKEAPLWACDFHEKNPKSLKILWKANGELLHVGCKNCETNYLEFESDLNADVPPQENVA